MDTQEIQEQTNKQQIENIENNQVVENATPPQVVNDGFTPSEEFKSYYNQEQEEGNQEPQAPTIEINDEVAFKFLKDKKGISVNSLDELIETYNKKSVVREELRPLEEFISKGNKVEDYITSYLESNKDYSNEPFEELTKKYLTEKGIDDKKITNKLKLLQLKEIDEEFMDEEEIKEIQEYNESITLEREELLEQALNHFNTKKESLKNLISPKQQTEEEWLKEREDFQNHVSTQLKDLDKIQINVGKFGSQTFAVSPELKQKLTDAVVMPNTFAEKYFDYENAKNGKVPYKEGGEKLLAQDLFFLENREAILETAFNNGRQLGMKEVQKNRENISFGTSKNYSEKNETTNLIPQSVVKSLYK